MRGINSETMIEHVKEALEELYKNDIELIEKAVHEVGIVAYFFHYFIDKFKTYYSDYNIDMEYNREGKNSKRIKDDLKNKTSLVRPDFIIHKRGNNKKNLLYIEFKVNKKYSENDLKKVKQFTSNDDRYQYTFGLAISLYRNRIEISQYENGKLTLEKVFNWNSKNFV